MVQAKSIQIPRLQGSYGEVRYRATWRVSGQQPSIHQERSLATLVEGLARRLHAEGVRSDGDAWKWLDFTHPHHITWQGSEWRCLDFTLEERRAFGNRLGKELSGVAVGNIFSRSF